MKPNALDREVSLDLRSDSGLFKLTLLHRLTALDVGWVRMTEAGKSRGTFREKWILKSEPVFAAALVEQLIYGTTIEQAAGDFLAHRMGPIPQPDGRRFAPRGYPSLGCQRRHQTGQHWRRATLDTKKRPLKRTGAVSERGTVGTGREFRSLPVLIRWY